MHLFHCGTFLLFLASVTSNERPQRKLDQFGVGNELNLEGKEHRPAYHRPLNQFGVDQLSIDGKADRPPGVRALDQFDTGNSNGVKGCVNGGSYFDYEKQVQTHVRRYVTMFLRYSKLKSKRIEDLPDHEYVDANLHVQIQVKHLRMLQRYFRDEKANISLQAIDACLSDVLVHTWAAATEDLAASHWTHVQAVLPDWTVFQYAMCALVLWGLVLWQLYGLRKAVVFITVTLTTVDAVQQYFKLLREAEVKEYSRLRNLYAFPPECDPTKKTWWATLVELFREDPCVALMVEQGGHFSEHVSLIQCLMKTHLLVFFQLPFESVGKVIANAAHTISGGAVYGWLLYPFTVVVLLIFLAAIGLVLTGFKFKAFSWFGGFEIGGTGESHNTPPAQAQVAQAPRPEAIAPNPNIHIHIGRGSQRRHRGSPPREDNSASGASRAQADAQFSGQQYARLRRRTLPLAIASQAATLARELTLSRSEASSSSPATRSEVAGPVRARSVAPMPINTSQPSTQASSPASSACTWSETASPSSTSTAPKSWLNGLMDAVSTPTPTPSGLALAQSASTTELTAQYAALPSDPTVASCASSSDPTVASCASSSDPTVASFASPSDPTVASLSERIAASSASEPNSTQCSAPSSEPGWEAISASEIKCLSCNASASAEQKESTSSANECLHTNIILSAIEENNSKINTILLKLAETRICDDDSVFSEASSMVSYSDHTDGDDWSNMDVYTEIEALRSDLQHSLCDDENPMEK